MSLCGSSKLDWPVYRDVGGGGTGSRCGFRHRRGVRPLAPDAIPKVQGHTDEVLYCGSSP